MPRLDRILILRDELLIVCQIYGEKESWLPITETILNSIAVTVVDYKSHG
jgi:hypothetical protein